MRKHEKNKISINSILVFAWFCVSLYIGGVILAFSVSILNNDRKEDLAYNQILADDLAGNADHDLNALINSVNMIFAEDISFAKLKQNNLSEFDWQGAAYLLQNNLSNHVNAMNHMCAMYFYDCSSDKIRFVWNEYSFSGSANLLLKTVRSYLKNTLSEYRHLGYFLYENELYFNYSFGKNGNYVGAVLNLSRYFKVGGEYALLIETDDGMRFPVYWNAKESEQILSGISERDPDSLNSEYLVTESIISEGCFKLLLIQKNSTMLELLNHSRFRALIYAFPVVLGVFGIMMLKGLKRMMFVPVERIYRRLSEIKMKETKAAPPETGIIEFDEINTQVDRLLDEMDTLQKEKYQEELRANAANLQYYELQVNPHFFLNCLNTINSLLSSENEMAAKDMIHALSTHFRYVFQNRKNMVRVEDELTEIESYCRIYSLKGGFPIILNVEAPDEVMEYLIPVLTIQTFVENSMKHAMKGDYLLNIKVQISVNAGEQEDHRLCIRISDNGPGYPEEILEELNQRVSRFEYKSEHVGIDNLKYRMYLLCGDQASCRFYNSPLGGAVTEFMIGEIRHEHTDN